MGGNILGVEAAPRGFAKSKQCGFAQPHSMISKLHYPASEATLCGFVKALGAASLRACYPRLLITNINLFLILSSYEDNSKDVKMTTRIMEDMTLLIQLL